MMELSCAVSEIAAPARADGATGALDALREQLSSMEQGSPALQRARLISALRAVNDESFGTAGALDTLLAVDRAWSQSAEERSRRYRRDPAVAAPDPVRFHFEMGEIERLFGEIYCGFAGLRANGGTPPALGGEALQQVTALALFHLGKYAKWIICNREQPGAAVWKRIHALVMLAVDKGFAARALAVFQTAESVASCGQLWLRTVMLATLATGVLSPRQVDRAEEWLQDWCRRIAVDQNYDESKHCYCVDIAGEAGPVRITPGLTMTRPVYLRTTHLHSDIVAARPHFLEKFQTSSLGWYAKNPLREFLDLLDQLQRVWASAPSQAPRRSIVRMEAPPDADIEVVRGFADILALCDPASGRDVPVVHWKIADYSEGGMGVVSPMDSPGAQNAVPVTQQLVALRWKESTSWQIGVIVRVMAVRSQRVHLVGVRLLAGEARLVTLTEFTAARPARDAGSQVPPARAPQMYRAFFLAGGSRGSQANSFLCPTGTVLPNMHFLLPTDRSDFVIQINRVIEGAGDWERIGFQVLQKRAPTDRPRA